MDLSYDNLMTFSNSEQLLLTYVAIIDFSFSCFILPQEAVQGSLALPLTENYNSLNGTGYLRTY